MKKSIDRQPSAFKIAFPVSSVWFGALVGPSMISGAFSIVYFAPYGIWGLLLPLVAMGSAAVIVGMGAEVARRHKVYDYHSYTKCIYGTNTFGRILCIIMEIYMIIAMIVGGSSVMAMGGIFLHDLLGINTIWGSIVMAVISIVLVLWGAKLVRTASTVMSVIMVIGMVLLTAFAVYCNPDELNTVISTGYMSEGANIWAGLWAALLLGLSNACNALTLSSVEQKLTHKKHSTAVGICSFILNSLAFIIEVIMVLPYCMDPEVLAQSVPVLYIVENFLRAYAPWLPTVYMITMFFGLVSSGAPQLHAVAARLKPIYPNKGIFKNDKWRNLVTGLIYFLICILISQFGLRAIISEGYTMLGYLAIPLLVIPICILMPLRWRKERKQKTMDSSQTEPRL